MKFKTLKTAIISLLAFCAMGSLGCASDSGDDTSSQTPQASITLSQSEVRMDVGEYTNLYAVLNDLEGTITWSSADTSIVAIIDGETLYGAGVGATTITATCNGFSASATVIVESDVITPTFGTFLSLSTYRVDLTSGQEQTISAWLEYKNGGGQITDIKLSYLSSNEEVVVAENGKLTAKKSGNAIVYVATKYQGETYVNSISVRVSDPNGEYVPSTLTVETAEHVYVKVGEQAALSFALMNGSTEIAASEYTATARVVLGNTLVEVLESDGVYSVKGLAIGNAKVEITCSYKGVSFTKTIHVGIS